MRSFRRYGSLSVLAAMFLLVLLMLTVNGRGLAGGMSQGGPQFGETGAGAPGAPPSPPPGERAGAGPAPAAKQPSGAPAGAAWQAQPPPKPASLTRLKTTVKVALRAKYGDEKHAEQRRYEATFEGKYVVKNKKDKKTTLQVYFPYPASADTLPEASVLVNGQEPDNVQYTQQSLSWETTFLPQQTKEITIKYRAFGTEAFTYVLDHNERMKELDFTATVTGTEHRPELRPWESLLPTAPLTKDQNGFSVAWQYTNLVTSRDITIEIPPPFLGADLTERVPRLSWAAAATVVLFGLVLFAGGLASGKGMAVSQYLLIVLALLVFYPTLLYLSKHLPVYQAFPIAFGTVSLLIIYSLRRAQGLKFALGYGGLGLIVLLGLFSAAALATKGAGVMVTGGALVLVAFGMYAAPRVAAARSRSQPRAALPPPPPPVEAAESAESDGEQQPGAPAARKPSPLDSAAAMPKVFCAFCGTGLEEGFDFCPHCGENSRLVFRCTQCGARICLQCGAGYRFCPGCGIALPTLSEPAEP